VHEFDAGVGRDGRIELFWLTPDLIKVLNFA